MNENQTSEILSATDAADDRRQNLHKIRHISADRSGSIDAVLSAMRACEKLMLTPEQINVGIDIVESIYEHGTSERTLATHYLIRYGMLLERDRKVGEL